MVPTLAGPRRPHDKVSLADVRTSFGKQLPDMVAAAKSKKSGAAAQVTPEALGARVPTSYDGNIFEVGHGSVVIAAITSCTNTSNPYVMLGAGLLAKNAAAKGLTVKPWVKTSLAPGSKVVTQYLSSAGVMPALESLKFHLVGYGCTTCIGNSGPLPEPISKSIADGDLVAVSVLSGNRNLRGACEPRRPRELPGESAARRRLRARGAHRHRFPRPSRSATTAPAIRCS